MSAATDLSVGGPCHAHPHVHDHSHDHDHGQSHDHDHGPTVQWRPHTAPGANPVLDIGGDVGALVVYLPELTPSGELEAHPTGRPTARFHTGVHQREDVWVAIFPEVVEGRYDLLDADGSTRAQAVVTGGEVSQLDLR